MCLFFHKWSKWSAPQPVICHAIDEVGNRYGEPWAVLRQTRTCEHCGKFQKRVVK